MTKKVSRFCPNAIMSLEISEEQNVLKKILTCAHRILQVKLIAPAIYLQQTFQGPSWSHEHMEESALLLKAVANAIINPTPQDLASASNLSPTRLTVRQRAKQTRLRKTAKIPFLCSLRTGA